MKKTQWKDSVRNIKKNIVSWLAVSVVTMICCGVFFGALFFVDAMNGTAADFARETNYEDINIVVSSGLKKDEVEKLKSAEGIRDAEGTWQLADSVMQAGKQRITVEIDGLTERISIPKIMEGELPQKAGECALTDQTMSDYDIKLGDKIKLTPSEDAPDGILKRNTYTVTARVLHPDCLSTVRSDIIFLSGESFDKDTLDDNYTYIRIDAEIPEDIRVLDDRYEETLLPIKEKLETDLKSIGKKHDKNLRDDAQKELDDTKEEVNADLADAKKKLDDAESDLDAREKQLEQLEQMGMASLDARASLEEAREQLDTKQEEYDDQKAQADEEIADAQQKIDDIKDSGYLLIARTQLFGYMMFNENITILQSLAIVFVIIFTIVGGIVVFSTITILIEGQRELIGTMKANGFRNREIMDRYLLFSILAVAFGMILSIGLEMFLQKVEQYEFGPMFCIRAGHFAFNGKVFAIMSAIEILVAAVVTIIVTMKTAIKTSAIDLMKNVSAPKRIRSSAAGRAKGSLYSRLIIRNLRTDLARVFCTMVIIAGSVLMIGVGFTFKLSLDDMMPRSAEVVNHYEIEAVRGADAGDSDYKDLKNYLRDEDISFAEIEKRNTMYDAGGFEKNVTVITGEEDIFGDYIDLADMNGQKLSLPDKKEALVCNRVSENSDIAVGDRIKLYDGDLAPHSVKVCGICRNYYGSLMYMSKEGYREVFDKKTKANTFLIRVSKGQDREAVFERIQKEYPAFEVACTDEIPEDFLGLTGMFTVLVIVMTGLSILMSVFVLMNLVDILVKRRKNELIIMRVIGFSYRQDIGYLLRETIVTMIGGFAGGVLTGCLMTDYLVRTVEGTETMYVRTINPTVWLFAVIIEGIFALLINLYAFRGVKKVKLVDIAE